MMMMIALLLCLSQGSICFVPLRPLESCAEVLSSDICEWNPFVEVRSLQV